MKKTHNETNFAYIQLFPKTLCRKRQIMTLAYRGAKVDGKFVVTLGYGLCCPTDRFTKKQGREEAKKKLDESPIEVTVDNDLVIDDECVFLCDVLYSLVKDKSLVDAARKLPGVVLRTIRRHRFFSGLRENGANYIVDAV